MTERTPMSSSLRDLDCPTRMFLVTACLTPLDLERLGASALVGQTWVSVETIGRSALHRMCAVDERLGQAICDLLDLRHLEVVGAVRASSVDQLDLPKKLQRAVASGSDIAGWAWALLTDPRPEVVRFGRQLMGECYVRGLRSMFSGEESSAHAQAASAK